MVIEEVVPHLPKSSEAIRKAYASCETTGRFIEVGKGAFLPHLEKAKSDLSRVRPDMENGYWDWVIIKSYYSMHHAINALLVATIGFYSKDHFCAILALKNSEIIPAELYAKLRKINAKFSDFTGFDVTYSLRKISQYDVARWKTVTMSDAEAVYGLAKEMAAFAERRCYENDIPDKQG